MIKNPFENEVETGSKPSSGSKLSICFVFWSTKILVNSHLVFWSPSDVKKRALPHGMCYSHYGNGVRNVAISIEQWGLLSDCYKVNPIG